ncbi:DNA mismatch repair protein MSH3, partial [Mucuna pruriens]
MHPTNNLRRHHNGGWSTEEVKEEWSWTERGKGRRSQTIHKLQQRRVLYSDAPHQRRITNCNNCIKEMIENRSQQLAWTLTIFHLTEFAEEDPDIATLRPELVYTLALILTTLGRAPDSFHCTSTRLSAIGNAAKVLSYLNKDSVDQGELIKLIIASEGQFPEVVRIRKAFKMAMEQLDSLICLYHKWFGMQNLELLSSSGTTHLIELSTDDVRQIAQRKQFWYHPPEVVTVLDELSFGKEELTVACWAAWNSFLRDFSKTLCWVPTAVQALVAFDCLHSLAIISRSKGCVRPMQICSDKHPVLETTLQDKFVPNDTNRNADGEYSKAKSLQDEYHIDVYQPASVAASLCTIEERALIAKAGAYT